MLKNLFVCMLAGLFFVPAASASAAAEKEIKKEQTLAKGDTERTDISGNKKIKLKIDPFSGLTEQEKSAIQEQVLNKTLRSELQGSRYRFFGISATPVKTPEGLRRYAYALLYDYTHNKTYNVVSDVSGGAPGSIVEVMQPSVQPPPNREEYEEAKQLVSGLSRVQQLLKQSNVILQDSFPVESPGPCDVNRCVEIQVNEIIPREKLNFLLLVTVDLSTRQIVEVRAPKTPTTLR